MVKILLIGHGAREHCIAESIANSLSKPELFAYMKSKNPAIEKLSENIKTGDYGDLNEIKKFAQKENINFAVIGPEEPLNCGVADALEEINIKSIGPKKKLAKLETSKSFARLLLKKYNIPGNPKFKIFSSTENLEQYLREEMNDFVIKPDGLCGGKGVWVRWDHFQTIQQAVEYCEEILKTHSSFLIEEKLNGEEFSLQCFTDGKTVVATPPVQDHKRAFNDDKGENTGGMGSYGCENHLLPFLKKEDIDDALKITQKVADALFKETGEYYKGIMYGGFMKTKYGIKLIEYNARFGDPEAMNILPILKTDFVEICNAIINEKLNEINMEFKNKATVCKYAVPSGYPSNPVKDQKIDLSEIDKIKKNGKIYYGSVYEKEDGLYMSGSRAIAFVGISDNIDDAEKISEKLVSSVKGPVFHREDIGTQKLLNKRIEHMKNIYDEAI